MLIQKHFEYKVNTRQNQDTNLSLRFSMKDSISSFSKRTKSPTPNSRPSTIDPSINLLNKSLIYQDWLNTVCVLFINKRSLHIWSCKNIKRSLFFWFLYFFIIIIVRWFIELFYNFFY